MSGGFSAGPNRGFDVRSLMIQFPSSYGLNETVSLEDDWIHGAELVVVRTTREGFVERTLEIAEFPLRAEARSTTSSFPPPAEREPTPRKHP